MSAAKIKILLIEDSLADQVIIERTLEEAKIHCSLTKASNGEQAIEMLAQQFASNGFVSEKPDLIFMDINMPNLSGIECLAYLKKNSAFKSIPVIILTTSNREKDISDCNQLGVQDYLIKPVSAAVLKAAIESTLNLG